MANIERGESGGAEEKALGIGSPTVGLWKKSVERVSFFEKESSDQFVDHLAVEEPLEIRVGTKGESQHQCLSITMRTPGNDRQLALGFMWTEGLITSADQVSQVYHCGPSGNVVRVELEADASIDWTKLKRHFYTTSSCGVCGKTSIEALRQVRRIEISSELSFSRIKILSLPQQLLSSQALFSQTGGIHAAGLFDREGKIIESMEDVGRHNAVDKLIGSAFQKKQLPLDQSLLVLSGRASFELIQKAYMSGIQMVVAVGAPSSLAVDLACEADITLVGFTKKDRYNIYSGSKRLKA